MVRTYVIKDRRLEAVKFDPEHPYVYITHALFRKLYTADGDTLADVNNTISEAMRVDSYCQLVLIFKRDGKYCTHHCAVNIDSSAICDDIPFKKARRLGGL